MSALENKRAILLQEYGLIALKEIVKILADNKIYYWVDAGTLLGIVRDNRFIKNDTDIDIAVVISNPDVLYKILQNNGYNIWYYYDDFTGIKRLIRAEKYNIGIDFEIFIKEGGKYFYDSPRELPKSIKTNKPNQKATIRFEFDANIVEDLIQYTFKGIKLNIPRDYDNYFSIYYKNWKSRVEKQDYLTGYFSCSIENYQHHNDNAYYQAGVYQYFHQVSSSTIKIGYIDKLIYQISHKLKFKLNK